MYRVSDLINLPILESSEGNMAGTVKTVILDIEKMTIHSVVCKENKISKFVYMVTFERVIGLDKNRVLIRNKDAISRVKHSEFDGKRFLYFENIIDKVVMNNTEDILGAIRDIIFDETDGIVKFYELSEGYIDDITKGRKKVDCANISKYDSTNVTFRYDNSANNSTSTRIC